MMLFKPKPDKKLKNGIPSFLLHSLGLIILHRGEEITAGPVRLLNQ